MTSEQILDELLEREGENKANNYLDPADRGGRTTWGVSERAHPEMWVNGPPTKDACRDLYRREYLAPWNWLLIDRDSEPLRVQVIDCTVHHGLSRAVKLLQQTIDVPVDGVVGPVTKHDTTYFITASDTARLLNNALVAQRLKFIDTLTDAEKSQKRFEEGWENRALSFLI